MSQTIGNVGGRAIAGDAPPLPPNLYEIQRRALRELVTLVESRASAEQAAVTAYRSATEGAEKDLNRAKKQAAAVRDRDMTKVEADEAKTLGDIQERFQSGTSDNDQEYAESKKKIEEDGKAAETKARSALQDAQWTADSLFEAAEKQANDDRESLRRDMAAVETRSAALWDRADPFLTQVGCDRSELPFPELTDQLVVDPRTEIEEQSRQADDRLKELAASRLRKLAGVTGLLAVFIPVLGLAAIPALTLDAESRIPAIAGGAGGALLIGGILFFLLRRSALRYTMRQCVSFGDSMARAAFARETALKRGEQDHARRIGEATNKRDSGKLRATEVYQPVIDKAVERRRSELREAGEKHARSAEKLREWHQSTLSRAEAHFGKERTNVLERYRLAVESADGQFRERFTEAKSTKDQSDHVVATAWGEGQDRIGRAINKLRANGLEHFPDWESPFWYAPPAAVKVPAGVRFGEFEVDLTQLPGGISFEDEGSEPTLPIRLRLPAFLPFPDRCSLLLKARDEGRARGVQALQGIMMRLLTAIPPGKLRFTIIDPVGLGENFAAFMHLTDYDEQLVGSRIWTEPRQIESRLEDVTAHMETVIQKYLRNQYRTIEEYNAQAGEVAEPFRVLVIANFPANFTLDACKRLVSIINAGPSCGVYTLITHDAKQPLPQGFQLSDVEQGSINLTWKDGTFVWKDTELSRFPLHLEKPPSLTEMTRLVRLVGERSKDANRVEVPFDYVAPRAIEIWSGDSRGGVSVAVGRAGATKRQMFALGKGTAQHGLIAGKTGSGKSTLLHALITNLAMNYSPDEVELYLIDFKKGVEFKAYATHRLPHARAVAIESEREFGLSVLQRLDVELRGRGELFRSAGVNSLSEYRDWAEKLPADDGRPRVMPRILLVVDEFQEFFVEDDKVAQECALLLDRLVRQGRAFGLHVLLGSQTLGGAFSLARSTIDQMAVRVALQCSDADAQLILSKDNTAARLLSRPGEAIYNDANGLMEGNNLFQVVWLDDDRREKVLADVRRRADHSGKDYPAPLVFEGNVPSVFERNRKLAELLDQPSYPDAVRAPSIWLGDAVAIKDPTTAVFRSVGGGNLLMVGQHDESALTIFASAIISLACQYSPERLKVFVLDGTPEDDPNYGFLGRVAAVVPHPVRVVDRPDIGAALSAVATEATARQKGESADRSPVFVFIHGLQRYRELRKEDDFGFGRRPGAERIISPAENLATIFRDGPTVGIYGIVWSDTPTNLGRTIDRAGMREFGMRILFQMSANDSSALIDSPAAARLGRNRALYVTEESPMPEKFRPYGPPSAEWLGEVRKKIAAKK